MTKATLWVACADGARGTAAHAELHLTADSQPPETFCDRPKRSKLGLEAGERHGVLIQILQYFYLVSEQFRLAGPAEFVAGPSLCD